MKLLEFFASILEAEVVFADGKALPGFHVYRSTPRHASQRFHVPHFDAQYKNLAWPESLKPKICRYEPGSIVIHDGHVLHQIEAWPADEGVCRITMQGHGIFLAGKWHIYW